MKQVRGCDIGPIVITSTVLHMTYWLNAMLAVYILFPTRVTVVWEIRRNKGGLWPPWCTLKRGVVALEVMVLELDNIKGDGTGEMGIERERTDQNNQHLHS